MIRRFPTLSAPERSAFSLIEVIIATAILLGSVVVLSRLAGMGREQSVKAALTTESHALCEKTLNEILLGSRPLRAVMSSPLNPETSSGSPVSPENETAFEGDVEPAAELVNASPPELSDADSGWRYSVRVDPLVRFPDLWSVTVEVIRTGPVTGRRERASLTRWIRGMSSGRAMQDLTETTDFLNENSTPSGLQP